MFKSLEGGGGLVVLVFEACKAIVCYNKDFVRMCIRLSPLASW